jgi:hypothetical protein
MHGPPPIVGAPLPAICQQLSEFGSAIYPAAQFWPGDAGAGGADWAGAETNSAVAAAAKSTVHALSRGVIS